MITSDYAQRVYAGVLGKIIAVYAGKPFEGWSYKAITEKFGEINYYVHEQVKYPLIAADDDISGTFCFLRALPDYGNSKSLTSAQVGQTWLNYLIEEKTVLWWGGMGMSTEHTAYLRLKHGMKAPDSGSIATNTKVVAEQIGAQIFIDGWALVAPGDPDLAVELAGKAARVSHDGEAVYGAQVIAAIEAMAFVEKDIDKLIDAGLARIPGDCLIATMIGDIRKWRREDGNWRKTRERIEKNYGYDKYGGNCHIIPNHALIILALLYGEGDFQKSVMIVNTSGWDTDCNSGNVGCIIGIRNGLAGFENGPDWRGPVADRALIPTADGGRCVTDALTEACHVVNIGRALAGLPPEAPKNGARFHFEAPGAVQGFTAEESPETRGVASVSNAAGHSRSGTRSLAIAYQGLATGRACRVGVDTFLAPEAMGGGGYSLVASPTLYPGQKVRAAVSADPAGSGPVRCRLFLRHYGEKDALVTVIGPEETLAPGAERELVWRVPDTGGQPIARIGLELLSDVRAGGTVYLDYLTWDGAPETRLWRPEKAGTAWSKAWVNAVSNFQEWGGVIQNEGRGMLIQGTREWTDYAVTATISPHMGEKSGIAARVQGLKRYYGLLLCRDGKVRLIKALDGDKTLSESPLAVEPDAKYELKLTVKGNRVTGWVNGKQVAEAVDSDRPLSGGAIALVIEEGRMQVLEVGVSPLA
jgi:ADP-ribosylglycohydrolase